jgi:putative tryptophan/tyrosine transport system substrate-binding protein
MRRRDFILAGGATMAWPLAARAQQPERMRRIGVLMALPEADPAAQELLSEFTQGLAELGWTAGGKMRMDVRWASDNVDLIRKFAMELVALQPDVILANSTPVTAALQRETQTIPIVFAIVGDPVGSGFVASLPRPGRNITGFGLFEASIPSKWLDLLKEIAPDFKRVAFMFNPDTAPYINSFLMPSFEAAAEAFKVTQSVAPVHSDAEIEAVITSLGREPRGVLLVGPNNFMDIHHSSIISLAARYNVPAIYFSPASARDGGLISYGADFQDIFRRAARYVDRILRGAKPSELPVQMPVKYLMIVNLRCRRSHSVDLDPSRSLAAKFTTMANAALAQRYAKAGVLGLRTGATRRREFITLLIL